MHATEKIYEETAKSGPLISAGGFRVTVKVAIKVDVRIAITVSS